MRTLSGVALLLLCCVHQGHRHIFVPKTPEAAQCWRECRAIAATCGNQPRPVNGFAGAMASAEIDSSCEEQRKDCLLTCPGAREEWRSE